MSRQVMTHARTRTHKYLIITCKRLVCIIDHYPLGNQRTEISGGLNISEKLVTSHSTHYIILLVFTITPFDRWVFGPVYCVIDGFVAIYLPVVSITTILLITGKPHTMVYRPSVNCFIFKMLNTNSTESCCLMSC